MNAGLHPLTSIHVHSSSTGTSLHAMETLKQFGVILPYLTSVKDGKTRPCGIKDVKGDIGRGEAVKLSLASGASFICGAEQLLMTADGGTVAAHRSQGVPLYNGLPPKSAWSEVAPEVERIEHFPDDIGLGRVTVHGYDNVVLGCGVVAVWS